jgi:hypothetical protein
MWDEDTTAWIEAPYPLGWSNRINIINTFNNE